MDMYRRRLLAGAGGLAVGLTTALREASAGKFKVSGEVLNRDNTPIRSVLVRAYRAGVKVGPDATTGPDGKYSIEFDEGLPIDTVRYERTGYNPGVVADLCGVRDHTINKVLYFEASKLSLFEGQQALSGMERVYYLERASNTAAEKIRETYAARIMKMDVPQELSERRQFVMKLYGIG